MRLLAGLPLPVASAFRRKFPRSLVWAASIAFVVGSAAASVADGRAEALRYEYDRAQPAQRPTRVISIIPAVTEMLFAIGAGPQVVAVGSFDRFPPEVEKLPRVGALIDPDVERILSLRPDLVVIYGSQTDLRTQLERAQIPIHIYSHAGLADVTVTIRTLGARTGHERAADDLATGIETRITAVRTRVAGLRRPRTSSRPVCRPHSSWNSGAYGRPSRHE